MLSRLISEYYEVEMQWDELIAKSYGDSIEVLSWQGLQRVIKSCNRIVKIQNNNLNIKVPVGHELSQEYRALVFAGGSGFDFEPHLKELAPGWVALELNIFDGNLLSETIVTGRYKLRAIISLFRLLFKLSMRGVLHKQIRPRHILVDWRGELCLIDFGGAVVCSPMTAFLANFGLVPFRLPQSLYLLKAILRKDLPKRSTSIKYLSEKFLQSVKEMDAKSPLGGKDDDFQYINVFDKLKKLGNSSIKHANSVPSFRLGSLEVPGNWDFEPVRRFIEKEVQFKNNRVLIVGSAGWLMGVFASVQGADIHLLEDDKAALPVLRDLFQAIAVNVDLCCDLDQLYLPQRFDYVFVFDLADKVESKGAIPRIVALSPEIYFIHKLQADVSFSSWRYKLDVEQTKMGNLSIFKVNNCFS